MDSSASDSSATSSNRHEYRLIISNLAHDVSRKDLEDHLRKVGEIAYYTKKGAIVGFSTPSAMKKAFKELNGSQLKGKRIQLTEYTDRSRSRIRSTRARGLSLSSPSPVRNRWYATENVPSECTSPVETCTESSCSTNELSDVNKRKAEPLCNASKRARNDRFRLGYRCKSRSSKRFRAISSSESSDDDSSGNSISFIPPPRMLRRSVYYSNQSASAIPYDSNSRSTSEEEFIELDQGSQADEDSAQDHEESGSTSSDVGYVSLLFDNLRACY
ncbi:serine-arginine protein 55-like [Ceratitis capitata]|uniref:serine-arginine protein 55-like n=1 Tax=Ceratitis capitata TaxID=7213 RepID=UPI000329E4CB|nr:serine-arginine protein 55-like [Ceratitis capitata]